MSDIDGAAAPADTGSVASNEPVIAATPTPVSTEPRTIPPGEAAERARQAEEAKLPADKGEPKKPAEPAAEKAKPISTREALRKAAEKVNAEPAKDAKPEAEKAAPLKDGQPRAEDGKFAPKDSDKPVDPKDAAKPAADTAKPAVDAKAAPEVKPASEVAKPAEAATKDALVKPALPSHTASEPPKRFSPDAKEAWASAPEPVRAEVARMEKELTQGFEKHRAGAEAFESVREFDDMAKKSGTDLKTALTNYTNMERVLRADPLKGLELICQNAGLSLRDVATHVMGQTPEQQASQSDATIRELRAELQQVKQQVGSVTETIQTQRTQTTQQKVEEFAAAHPRFEELADDIASFMRPVRDERGQIVAPPRSKDLAEAYSLAERLNPAPVQAKAELPAASSAPINELLKPDLAAQTAKGSKSITGAPTAGSEPVLRQPSTSIRDALRKARAAAG